MGSPEVTVYLPFDLLPLLASPGPPGLGWGWDSLRFCISSLRAPVHPEGSYLSLFLPIFDLFGLFISWPQDL